MDIKVLGPGCSKCKVTHELIDTVAKAMGANITLTKIEDVREIVGHGIFSTPAVVIDGKIVHAGGVPARQKVEGWLK